MLLMLISCGMKYEADRGSFLWDTGPAAPQTILSMGFYFNEDPPWDPLELIFFQFHLSARNEFVSAGSVRAV